MTNLVHEGQAKLPWGFQRDGFERQHPVYVHAERLVLMGKQSIHPTTYQGLHCGRARKLRAVVLARRSSTPRCAYTQRAWTETLRTGRWKDALGRKPHDA